MSTYEPTEADWADFAAWSERDLTALREGIAARDARIEKLMKALQGLLDVAEGNTLRPGNDWKLIDAARAALEDTQ